MITFKCILVPLDGSLAAETALPLAEALAQKFESELLLLHVIDLSPALAGGMTPTFPFESSLVTIREWAYKNAASYLSLQVAELRRRGVNVKNLLVETSAASPAVAEAIIETALSRQVDLIVMTAGLHRSPWTLVSVTDQVMQRRPCPVLLAGQSNPAENEANTPGIRDETLRRANDKSCYSIDSLGLKIGENNREH